uniref:CFA20 domain-containing protein n=1 Tax=Graphocephala atropunctata TaxID=36148 RepID=A0A1B6L9A2_9HEMI
MWEIMRAAFRGNFKSCWKKKKEPICNHCSLSLEMSGSVEQVKDKDLKRRVQELTCCPGVSTFFMHRHPPHNCPRLSPHWLTLHVKYAKRQPFSFEVRILDDTDTIRRFWFSTYTDTRVTTYLTRVPLQLARGWHIVQVNLAEFTEKTYGTTYLETLRVQVHGNCRLHQIFFSDYNNV